MFRGLFICIAPAKDDGVGISGAAGRRFLYVRAGYKFVVEPLGPESLDDGSAGPSYGAPDALLGTPLTSLSVQAQAVSDLAGSDLFDEYGLSGGGFDFASEMLLDPTDENDWLVPYKRGSDVTGAVLVNAETGQIEQATWIDSGETPFQLTDLQDMYAGLYDGFIPQDNVVPEPGTVSLVLVGVGLLAVRRRRKS